MFNLDMPVTGKHAEWVEGRRVETFYQGGTGPFSDFLELHL